jgi:hypothetical protein
MTAGIINAARLRCRSKYLSEQGYQVGKCETPILGDGCDRSGTTLLRRRTKFDAAKHVPRFLTGESWKTKYDRYDNARRYESHPSKN